MIIQPIDLAILFDHETQLKNSNLPNEMCLKFPELIIRMIITTIALPMEWIRLNVYQ